MRVSATKSAKILKEQKQQRTKKSLFTSKQKIDYFAGTVTETTTTTELAITSIQ